MTTNQSNETRDLVAAAVVPSFGQRLGGWIQDPFASAFLATGMTATAITFVLTGMWLVSIALG